MFKAARNGPLAPPGGGQWSPALGRAGDHGERPAGQARWGEPPRAALYSGQWKIRPAELRVNATELLRQADGARRGRPWWAGGAECAGSPLRRQGCYASLRDGLRPPL